MDVHTEIKTTPAVVNNHDGGSNILLASNCTDRHLNIYIERTRYGENYVCFTPADAQRLRDELLRIYPLPVAASPTKRSAPKGEQAYKGNGKHVWEPVIGDYAGGNTATHRLRVPGGWLYRTSQTYGQQNGQTVTTFVPMPEIVNYPV